MSPRWLRSCLGAAGALLGASLGAALLGACAEEAGTAPRAPAHVLLISLDSTRADALGAYGFRSRHAPGISSSASLDRLAGEGVLFEQAYATSSWTLPSHASLLTGEPELVHAVDIDWQRPDPARPTLAELLGRSGWRTAGFYSGPYLEPHFGLGRGFGRYEACYGAELSASSAAFTAAAEELERLEQEGGATQERLAAAHAAFDAAMARIDVAARRDRSSAVVADAVIEELRRAARTGEPCFVFAHFFDPHYDYVPPAPWDRAFDPEYQGAITGEDFFDNPAVAVRDPDRPSRMRRVVSDRDLEHLRMLYAGEVAATDAEIGRVLDELERLGLADDTLVVVTADHGDEFFEHGGIGHRTTLFEELVRVPLLLRLPGALPAGERVAAPVSTIDVVPTVLELLGLPAPEGLASRSLLGALHGREDGDQRIVLGRLVRQETGYVSVAEEEGGAEQPVPGRIFTLEETFRRGTLKLTRARRWFRAEGAVDPALAAPLERRSRRLRARESLRWIDLERYPGEPLEGFSTDFSDERAALALRDLRALYARLLARRGHADLIEVQEAPLAALRGLGYADVGAPTVLGSEDFAFPVPGERLDAQGDAADDARGEDEPEDPR